MTFKQLKVYVKLAEQTVQYSVDSTIILYLRHYCETRPVQFSDSHHCDLNSALVVIVPKTQWRC